MKLGHWLKKNRITAREFGASIGASKGAVQKWVSGERFPRPKHLLKIKNATKNEVTPKDFLQIQESESHD
jgi:transcriptional regulator with XRE-family HTH domain